MPAKLFSMSADEGGERQEFSIGAEARIGRGSRNDVVLPLRAVSVEHSRIYFDPKADCYVLEDLGSLNGTALDGARIEEPERLGHLHVVTFAGELDFVFQDLDKVARRHGGAESPAPPRAAPSPSPASKVGAGDEGTRIESEAIGVPAALAADAGQAPAGPPEANGTRIEDGAIGLPPGLAGPPTGPGRAPTKSGAMSYILEVAAGGPTPQRFELRSGPNLVGRIRRAEIRIEKPEISRRHAVLSVEPERVTVRDLGTRNHTYVEGERIGEDEVELAAGARLSFATVEARLFARSRD